MCNNVQFAVMDFYDGVFQRDTAVKRATYLPSKIT